MTRTQQNRAFQVETPLGKDVLLFYRLSGTEKLGALFEFQLEVLSENHSINPDELLGRSVTASVEIDSDKTRYFNGLATTFIQDGCIGDLARYRIAVRPWLWLLTRTADCRIFQNKSVPEIVTEVFKQKGFTDVKKSLNGTYAKREYCVQYSETDFDFASRLLESEGIYYYFAHEKGKHTLVLADGRGSHQTVSGYDKVPYFPPGGTVRRERDHIDSWSFSREVQPGTFATTDFDFTRPKADLQVKSSVKRNHAQSAFEVFNYPGGYLETKDGEGIVRARIEQYHSHFEQSVGTGNARGLATGSLFKLEKFPRQDQNSEYLLTSVTYNIESDSYQSSGGGGDESYSCSFTALETKQTYRPSRLTPRPSVQGPQTAIVVGKKNEDIWTDKYGRIKVQFHWDRYGQKDENSSCWVRVAQIWAGKKWGGIYIPRIGQEVIVEFLDGDPDRPIVTGSVYNADHMPPYNLPDDMTQSGIKSQTTKNGNEKTFNELRFEDKKDAEQVYFHAEKNFDRVVENNDTLKVGFDKKDPGDQTVEVYNDHRFSIEKGNRIVEIKEKDDILTVTQGKQTVTIEGDTSITVKTGNRSAKVETGNEDLKVAKGNHTISVDSGNQTITVAKGNQDIKVDKGDHSLKVGSGTSTIEAGTSIELKVGSSSIKIESAKITLKSNEICLDAGSKLTLKGSKVEVKASGDASIKGSMVKIN